MITRSTSDPKSELTERPLQADAEVVYERPGGRDVHQHRPDAGSDMALDERRARGLCLARCGWRHNKGVVTVEDDGDCCALHGSQPPEAAKECRPGSRQACGEAA